MRSTNQEKHLKYSYIFFKSQIPQFLSIIE